MAINGLTLWDRIAGDTSLPLGVRLFRVLSLVIAAVALGLAEAGNVLQDFPWPVHAATIGLGVFSATIYYISRRGYHLQVPYIVLCLLMLNLSWFGNGGSYSGLPLFLFPLLCLTLVIFTGWLRYGMCAIVVLNIFLLLFLEWRHPEWLSSFPDPTHRLMELLFGVFCCSLVIVASIGLLVYSHVREHQSNLSATRELQASDRYARALFDATSEAIIIHNAQGRVLNVNRRMCEMFRCTRAEALQHTIADLSEGIPPYSGDDAPFYWERSQQQGAQLFEWHCRRFDGALFWAEVGLSHCELGNQLLFIAALRDVSERKQADASLRLTEERQRQALEASQQGWFEINLQTGEGYSSPEYVRLIGHDPATFVTTLQTWLESIHTDDRALTEKIYRECISSGKTRILEYRRRAASGEWKWIRSTARVVEYDAQGRPLRLRGTHADVTDRKTLEARLLHTQRLEALGTLTNGIAHELNNVLTPMLLSSGLIQQKLSTPADRELARLFENGAQRAAQIVRQLLAFSRHAESHRLPVAAGSFLPEVADIVRVSFPPNIVLTVSMTEDLWKINADPTQIHQVLMNLCMNAREAMPRGGTLKLSAENVPALDRHATTTRALSGEAYVMFRVADTGKGIDPEILDRIFDPFFTTKEVGQGPGLGLSTVHGIVESHGGFVTVESELGHGSIFSVYLPACAAPAPETARPADNADT